MIHSLSQTLPAAFACLAEGTRVCQEVGDFRLCFPAGSFKDPHIPVLKPDGMAKSCFQNKGLTHFPEV